MLVHRCGHSSLSTPATQVAKHIVQARGKELLGINCIPNAITTLMPAVYPLPTLVGAAAFVTNAIRGPA